MSNLTNSLSRIKSEMRAKILSASEQYGGKEPLSIALGKSKTYVTMVLNRDSLSGLQKLYGMIEKLKGE